MGMINGMMVSMVESMSPVEREDVMLKMMPLMMKEVEPRKLAPNMLQMIAGKISLLSIYHLLKKIIDEKTLIESINEKIVPKMEQLMPAMMKIMGPFMMKKMKKHCSCEMMGCQLAKNKED